MDRPPAHDQGPTGPGAPGGLGWDAARAADLAALGRPGAEPGRVARVDRGAATVLTARGALRAATAGLDEALAVGDWVALDEEGAAVAVLPRRSAVTRRDAGGTAEAQVLAANVDHVVLLHPLDGPPNLRRIERELVVAWDSGAEPVVALTKADRVDAAEAEAWVAAVAAVAPGVAVLATSALSGAGLEGLEPYLAAPRTVVLLGPSGAGKSSMVNALVGEELQRTGEVRARDGKGRHTTVASQLVQLRAGGILIDTPGLRALALWDAAGGLELAFADVEALAEGCRFDDCVHDREPGCAVRAAVADGTLSPERLESWQRLRRELEATGADRDARAQAERKRADRIGAKALRASYKLR